MPYEAQWLCTLRNDQRAASSAVLWQALGPVASGRRIGVEYSSCGLHITQGRDAQWIDIEPDLYRLRRRKDPDELARLETGDRGHRRHVCPGARDRNARHQRARRVQRAASRRGAQFAAKC